MGRQRSRRDKKMILDRWFAADLSRKCGSGRHPWNRSHICCAKTNLATPVAAQRLHSMAANWDCDPMLPVSIER